jgi:hypothetical protein
MKKIATTLALLIAVFRLLAQSSNSNSILVRHDTTTLKASECEWIIKSLVKNDPGLTAEIGKSVSLVILQAIEKGKVKAIDRETNKLIPGKEIFTWQMPVDTVPQFNMNGDLVKYMVIKSTRSSDDIRQIRVYQDWYFDISTGKLRAIIKWIELLEEVHTSYSGLFLGYRPFCRIFY